MESLQILALNLIHALCILGVFMIQLEIGGNILIVTMASTIVQSSGNYDIL